MSSLRIESLRLVWLETFLQVTEAENLSAASREMGVDQSTVSRHIQALEKWAGKPLLELYQGEDDGEDIGRMSRMTPAGGELLAIALEFVPKLEAFRTEEARRKELLEGLEGMIAKMLADLESRKPSQAAERWRNFVVKAAEGVEEASEWPMEILEKVASDFRILFKRYEWEIKRERRFNRTKAKATKSARSIKVPPLPS